MNKVFIYLGKLGHERLLQTIEIGADDVSFIYPEKKDLIYIPNVDAKENEIYDGETYVVKQVLIDYVHNEYSVFVELYDWEG